MNINTKSYWDDRFRKRTWGSPGREQTLQYAKANVRNMDIDSDFPGSILDFGCALGDAIPIYRTSYPLADLYGLDLSPSAIEQCRLRYGKWASFDVGTYESVNERDIIIASHVMEHITNDKSVVRHLLCKCRFLYVVVPFKENPLHHEHVNYYEEDYYDQFDVLFVRKFTVRYDRILTLRERVKKMIRGEWRFRLPIAKDMVLYKMTGKRVCAKVVNRRLNLAGENNDWKEFSAQPAEAAPTKG